MFLLELIYVPRASCSLAGHKWLFEQVPCVRTDTLMKVHSFLAPGISLLLPQMAGERA